MPELPEAERARREIEKGLGRLIEAVDDHDTYVCRPHAPGEIAAALVGRRLTAAHRRGKFLWVDTADEGPQLGLHLGMAGRIVVDGGASVVEDVRPPRFAIHFADGGRLALHDARRFSRAVLEPDFSHVGPDAGDVSASEFVQRVGRSTAPLKARLLDQEPVAGIGNLLADEILWRARLSPERPAGDVSAAELRRLHARLQEAIADAVRLGGVHTGVIVPHRAPDGVCPRCNAAMRRSRVGGRTTWWCASCQT